MSEFLAAELGRYDISEFPEDQLYTDECVSVMGAPIHGWVPELFFRYTIFTPEGLNVDWAIALNVRRVEDGGSGPRRKVERIDICHSEVHSHRFKMSDDPDDDLGRRKKLVSLYAGDAVTVNDQWDLQMHILSREWPQRVERWIDG